jgi:hypothetical protein
MSDNKDFFGYSRKVKAAGEVLTAEFATITLGDDPTAVLLLQSAQFSYQHNVAPFYEIGSADLYWTTGQPMGAGSISRAVGQEGFLQKFGKGSACSKIQSIGVGLKKSGGCLQLASAGKGFNLLNCIPESVTVTVQAGALQMQEGLSMKVGALIPE